jgi:hypothetical protein
VGGNDGEDDLSGGGGGVVLVYRLQLQHRSR